MPTAPLVDWPALHGDALRDARALVTGGAGFIGSHVADALVALGARVTVLDDLTSGAEANLPDGVRLLRGSVLDDNTLHEATRNVELVFHLAALVSVPHSVEDPWPYHQLNAGGTLRVLDAAAKAGARRVVYSASSSAYGDAAELPKREAMPDLPKSPYAASKLAGEAYVRAWASCYDVDAVSLRYFNIFGPRQKADSAYAGVVAAFAKRLLANERPTIYGDGSASRDMTFVANAVHANLLAARRAERFNGEVVNVGTGVRTTVAQLADAMARAAGTPELTPKFDPPRAGDVAHSQADLTRAKAVLGYEPVVGLDAGLSETVAWYRTAREG